MDKNKLYDALSKIDEKHLCCSEDNKYVASEFKKSRNRKIKMMSSVLCVSLVILAVCGKTAFQNGNSDNEIPDNTLLIDNNIDTTESEQSDIIKETTNITNDNVTTVVTADLVVSDTTNKETQNNPETAHDNTNQENTGSYIETSAADNITNITTKSESSKTISSENKDIPAVTEKKPVITNEPDYIDVPQEEVNLSGRSLEEWLSDPKVVWGSDSVKGDTTDRISLGSVKVSSPLSDLMKSGNSDTVYAVMVDFSSCIDENDMNSWNYNGDTINDLKAKITELTTYSDQTYTYVDSDGIEHTGYFVSSENEVEIKELVGRQNEIKTAYYNSQIEKFKNSFSENGLEIYKSNKEYDSSFSRFYTFASKEKLINFRCKSDEAFVFYPAGYFK